MALALYKPPVKPGEPPRLCIKRPKSLTFASDLNKRLRAQEGRKPPEPPEPDTVTTKKEDDQKNDEKSNNNSLEPHKEDTGGDLNSSDVINSWTKKVGVENLYQLLLEEHQDLQKSHHSAMTRLREEERQRFQLEDQLRECRRVEGDNVINLALAEQIQDLQERQVELETEAQELREQNDLLEFRILELDDGVCAHSCSSFHFKSPSSRSPDTRDREIDDVSDSGVMSLPTSEDISEADFQDFKMEPNNRDVKSRLAQLCQSLENVSERISIQQALALLRHYETRLENLEATLAAMCQEATQTKTFEHLPSTNGEHAKSPSRIIATVLPFTDLSSTYHGKDVRDDIPLKRMLRDQDCMQESGIFEDGGLTSCVLHMSTQTDWTFDPPPGDLGAEIRKLTQIRERIEEKGGNKKLLKTPETDPEFLTHASLKELLFYRERVQLLEDKLTIYESRGDDQSKLLARRLEKEVLLEAQLKHFKNALRHLKEINRCLEEEKCEFEEAENDTRLRCQKLEVKLSALGEKKSDLQVQLQQNARTMSNLRSTLSEEERKRNEARQYAAKMEALVNRLEQQNFEMEEKEMEVRYRLHSLENVVPAMVMYYLWRMLNAVRPFLNNGCKPLSIHGSSSDSLLVIHPHQNQKKLRNSRQSHLKAQENLRRSLEEIEQFLTSKQRGETPISPNITADAAFLVIEELSDRCHRMEEKIKELELKEKVYQETLQNGDDILSKMEMDYKHQYKCAEDELLQKHAELEKAESQLRKLSDNRELESQFQERLNQLDTEICHLREVLAQKDKEKKMLEEEHIRLTTELEEALDNLDKFKENIEKSLREEVEYHKKRVKELLGDLDIREQEREESDEMHTKLVKELKKINNQACRELEESEVTISELKEEVQTLEREVAELRLTLSEERDSCERLLIQVGAELEAKDRQIRSLGSDSLAGSLHEELLDVDAAERRVDDESTTDVAASTSPPTAHVLQMYDCQRIEQVIKEFDPKNALNSLDQITTAYQHSRTCRYCRNTNSIELRRILTILQKSAPQSKMIQILPDQPNEMTVSFKNDTFQNKGRYTGPNQPSTSFTVTKNIQILPEQQNEKIVSFKNDTFENEDRYTGPNQPSTSFTVTKNIQILPDQPNEKTVSLKNDTFENEDRYTGPNQSSTSFTVTKNVRGLSEVASESVASLRWTVFTLLAKCRVKDHMIRCLADQLRICPWLAQDLFTHLSSDPPHTFDFNRTSLHEYINNRLGPDITGIIEGEYDPGYSSANPLILRVVEKRDPLSLLVAWTLPSSNFVMGFQIVVEGQLCERIYSAARTSTVLHPVDLRRPVTLTISALQSSGQIIQEHSLRYPPLVP